MKRMTVKDVSAVTGIPRETLRYYEKLELLPPARRAGNGYRLFDATDLERLEFIKVTKQAGFRLREIRELLNIKERGEATCRVGREIALRRIAELERKIEAQRKLRKAFREFARRCEEEGLERPCSLSFECPPLASTTIHEGTRQALRGGETMSQTDDASMNTSPA